MSYTTKDLEVLVKNYTCDMLYDSHKIETRIQRSEAGKELRQIGSSAFNAIAAKMKGLFPLDQPVDHDMLIAYTQLIYGIINDHNLPPAPYDKYVKYSDQDPRIWIAYCEENG